METLYGVVVIGGGRCELFLTTGTGSVLQFRNPSGSVFATEVNKEIRLHLAGVRTERTDLERRSFGGVRLYPVLLEPALLDKCFTASRLRTDMGICAGVFLHMIEHGVLTRLRFAAVRADEVPDIVAYICEFFVCCQC